MALTWIDRVDGDDFVMAADVNSIAAAVIADEAVIASNTASISDLSADVEFPVTNIVTNGDFPSTTDWLCDYGTLSVSNGVATETITSLNQYNAVRQVKNLSVGKHYVSFEILPKYANATLFYPTQNASNPVQITPTANTWNKCNGIINVTVSSNQSCYFMHKTNTNYAIGDTIQYRNMLFINLTERFGAGNEPTAAEMDAILAFYTNSWFNGAINLASNPKMLPYLLNATRNRPIITSGTFAARPTSVIFPTLYLSTDKAAGNADRLTLNMGGTTWLQI